MKFVVSKIELLQAIRKLNTVVPQNPHISILSHLLIEASHEQLHLTATDLMITVRVNVVAKIIEPGSICIPAKRLFGLIKELPDSPVIVSIEEQQHCVIHCCSSFFRLHTMPAQEYPAFPDLSEMKRLTVSSEQLKEMLFQTAFAVSREESRYAITGVLMRLNPQEMTFVGTDGKRLAKAVMPYPCEEEKDYIIPIKAVEEISKLLEKEGMIHIHLGMHKIALEGDGCTLVTQLLSGEYPHFEEIINTKSEVFISLHRDELASLLRQVALFTSDTSHSIHCTFRPQEMLLSANCSEIGEGRVSMPIDYQGKQIDIAFNPHYFLDILKHIKEEQFLLGLSDAFTPGMIVDGQGTLFILMPMRLHALVKAAVGV